MTPDRASPVRSSLSPRPLSFLRGLLLSALGLLTVCSLPGCGGGGGGSSPPAGTKPFTISFLSTQANLMAGEPYQISYRISGPGSGLALETMILWDTSSHAPDVSKYPNRSPTELNLAVPGDFYAALTSPFAPVRIYYRAYARVRYNGDKSIVMSEEKTIDVSDVAYTTEDPSVGLLVSGFTTDAFGGFGYVSSDGYLYSLAGATYSSDAGTSLTVWFGTNGLPIRAASSSGSPGVVFEYSNWGKDTVDVTVSTFAGGVVDTESGIAASESSISNCRALWQEDFIGKPTGTSQTTDLVTGTARGARLVHGMSSALLLAATIAGRLAPPAGITDSVNAVAALSTGTMLPAGDQLSGNETLDQVGTLLNGYACLEKETCLPLDLAQVSAASLADTTLRITVLGK